MDSVNRVSLNYPIRFYSTRKEKGRKTKKEIRIQHRRVDREGFEGQSKEGGGQREML